MSIYIGSNAGDTITPDLVSANVIAIGAKKPSAADDLILAGNGNDVVAGGGGNDIAFLGGGNDTFIWKSGDGSDIVDGGSGTDRLTFGGASASENITVSSGILGLAQVTRNVGNVNMTLTSVERIDIAALDGQDRITVNDLSHTDVKDVFVNLAGAANPITGDGVGDVVTVNGTAAADVITVALSGTSIVVGGLAARTTIDNSDAIDQLAISGGNGNDVITAGNGLATKIQLTIDGGAGNDIITGGDGADVILGGDGNDAINGGRGNDTAQLGAGDDTFVWNPGDGSDIVEGNAGTDTLQFNGANVNEDMTLTANGSHAILTRNVAAITMDLHGMETVNITALGGVDNITIGNLAGTGVKQVNVDLAATGGGDDNAVDTVTVAGSAADDAFAFTVPTAGLVSVKGLGGEQITVDHMGVGDRVVFDGGAGNDTVTANGTSGNDVINIVRDGTATVAVVSGSGPIIDIANVEHLVVQGGAGNDTLAAQNGIGALTQLTLDGGAGNDTLLGGDGNDILLGGDGNDFVDGNIGSDTANLGAGDDVFSWDPGDGSDVVEGGTGTDTLQFNGSNAGENMVLSASGSHAVLTRNVANITMDLHGIENVNIRALGSVDNINIGDLTGTDVKQVHVDLAAFDGSDDGAIDTVTVGFTAGDDAIKLDVHAGPAVVNALGGAQVFVDNMGIGDHFVIDGGAGNDRVTASGTGGDDVIDLARDGTANVAIFTAGGQAVDITNLEQLLVEGGAGNDTIRGQNGIGALTQLTLDGGAGNDTLLGGDGNDILLGGDGNDFVDGNIGSDIADLGAGDDVFGWDPGDGSDVVEGGTGNDTLQFNGSNAGENMLLTASGSHAVLTRNVANISMDLHGIENVNIRALGSVDNINIGDLTGTDVKQVHVNLAAFDGSDDGAIDTVTVGFTAGDDAIKLNVHAGPAVVNALGGAQVFVDNMGIGDHFVIDGGAGNDSVTASGTGGDDVIGLARDGTTNIAIFGEGGQAVDITNVEQLLVEGGAGNDTITGQNGIGALTHLTIDGGTGNDRIFGGDGNDTLLGGDGNDFVDGNIGSDTADLGAGDDVFGWDPGDGSDVVEGGSGNDTLQFNGSNAGENMALSANGSHAVLTRNVANITMDLHGMENVNIRALGSVDNITIGDLTGTDVKQVHVDLAAFDGSDDGSADTVTVGFTAGDDAINFDVHAGQAVVNALGGAQVFVDNQGVGDRFVIDGGAGNDSLTAHGTGGDDVINLANDGTGIAVFATGGQVVSVTGVEQLLVEGGAGNDTITGQNGIGTLTHLTIDGGTGNDTIFGGDGDDTILGGDGNDLVNGARGNDTAQLGAGDDTFVWNPGDGSDVVEGNSGTDTLQFNGSNAGENMLLSASGSHAILTRDVGAITMDLHGVETVNIAALGSADNITVGDMNGTDVKQVNVDLAQFGGGADGQVDTVTVNGTSGSDAITLSMRNGALVVGGLSEEVVIKNFDPNDVIHIAGLGGDDIIDASALGAGGPKIVLDGGDGDDVLLGGAGDDNLQGGAGDDVLLGGAGSDVLDGGTGDNVVIQDIAAPAAPAASSAHEFAADPHAVPEHEAVAAVHADHPLL